MSTPPIKAVLLDLDGTLLDTAPDMALALNLVRRERHEAEIPFAAIRPHVSHGAAALIRIGFPQASDEDLVELRARFLEHYSEHLSSGTRVFDGFVPVLAELERRGIHWGIVTNKPAFLTDPLVAALQLDRRASCVVSGDTVAQRKPHPASLLHAAQLIKCEPAHCLYVGDAERDVKAAHAAGMRVLVALFGYLADTDHPQDWQADGLINTPGEVLDWVTASARPSPSQATSSS